ncbi:hypothetical protein BDV93DRAFT_564829 [Ceratobasidium sp. AG-I]|nr:hypothetical protein BDV93DRAFT_564829 [Ceratobasidium sp. AG-I]
MSTFTRIAVFAALMLSLSYLVSALPASVVDGQVPATIVGCGTMAELTTAADILVGVFKGCAEELIKSSASVSVSVEAQASIVACFASIIALLVKVCAAVSVKFGPTAVLVVFAKIDVAVRLCLFNLNICVNGILVLIAKAIPSATVGVMPQFHLKLCLNVLGLVGVSL